MNPMARRALLGREHRPMSGWSWFRTGIIVALIFYSLLPIAMALFWLFVLLIALLDMTLTSVGITDAPGRSWELFGTLVPQLATWAVAVAAMYFAVWGLSTRPHPTMPIDRA